jgi:lipopolysaccharide/colanic/teichoic acid biosynthesis glycosyltransferase
MSAAMYLSAERNPMKEAALQDGQLSPYFLWKNVLERCLALVMLIPGLPLIGLLVLAIKATSRGPGVYSQQRVGRGGRVFTMYKLRSMRIDAESSTGPVWSQPGKDTRVTPLGYWLRKLHLDELPQLLNVVRGEMSLIGPRPERPEFVTTLAAQIPGYLERLQVLPGITGLAQINLPPDTDLDDVRRKLVLDQQYIAAAGPLLDVRILACTLLRLCGIKGESTMRLMGLRREVVLASELSPDARLSAPPVSPVEAPAPAVVTWSANVSPEADAAPAPMVAQG